MNMRFAFACTAIALLLATPLAAAEGGDAKFLKEAITGDNSETMLGKLAQDKGKSQGVRDFGKTLSTDHADAKEKAVTLAKSMDVSPPTEAAPEAQKEEKKLSGMSGDAFDQEFVNYMIDDHKKDIAEFSKEAKNSKNEKVAQLAKDTLPTLKKHLDIAISLHKEMQTSKK